MIVYIYILLFRGDYLSYFCEICRKEGDIHHIVHRSEGGLDFELNYKYLCPNHHRGKNGPHKDKFVDLKYKLEMQIILESTLKKEFYSLNEVYELIHIKKNQLKRLSKNLKLYKEGYLSKDIIFELMGRKKYSKEYIEDLLIEELLLHS